MTLACERRIWFSVLVNDCLAQFIFPDVHVMLCLFCSLQGANDLFLAKGTTVLRLSAYGDLLSNIKASDLFIGI